MDPFLNEEQTSDTKEQPLPYQLMEYLVSCSPPANLPSDWKKYAPENFISIHKDIILIIANYLSRFDRGALEQVCKYFLIIIRLEWPPMPEYLLYYPDTKIQHLLKRNFYELCKALHNVEITYNNVTSNSKKGPARYLARRSERPYSDLEVDLSQLEGFMVNMVEFEKDNNLFTQLCWNDYMKNFQNLVYMAITDADLSSLDIEDLTKLEGFFAKFNSAGGHGEISLPPNIKEIILYASEENYQEHHTQFSKGYLEMLDLYAQKCTKLEFW
jgi:hypothetical protein